MLQVNENNYAVVADGVITNVIVVAEGEEVPGTYPLPEGKWIGDPYQDGPTTEDRLDALEAEKADKTEVQAVWESMAAAIQEGVESA